MAVVYSTDVEEVKVQARGNWFTFRPGQIKVMDDNLAHFLCTDKAYMGFVSLPDVCIEEPNSPDAQAAKDEGLASGRRNIIMHLNKIINNLEVSLQRDLDVAGIKVESLKYASEGERKAYKKLAAFKAEQDRQDEKAMQEIKKIKEELSGATK